uniref:LBH domain-containing protein n=1 Tax=Gouania willdenowi TaxID=441366 RepID=A0A8C5DX40_GOUWI
PISVQITAMPTRIGLVLSQDLGVQQNKVDHEKERLPSIVVEPTEISEVESGELRWPPENMDMDEDEEDLFLEQMTGHSSTHSPFSLNQTPDH